MGPQTSGKEIDALRDAANQVSEVSRSDPPAQRIAPFSAQQLLIEDTNSPFASAFAAQLLGIGGRHIAQRRVQTYLVIDRSQKLNDLGAGLEFEAQLVAQDVGAASRPFSH